MRLALVTETFPPDVNGVAMTLERLVAGMTGRGHEVTIIRPIPRRKVRRRERSRPANDIRLLGFPLPRYPDLQFGRPAWGTLKRCWQQERPDLVHIATEGPLGVTALWAARQLGIPVSSSFHTNFHHYGEHYGYSFLMRLMEAYGRYFHNRTAATFAPSEGVKVMLEKMGIERVSVLGRGVDTQLYGPHRRSDPLRASWGVMPGDPVVIYVGRIALEKNLPVTVAAFRAFQQHQPRARMVLVGDGPERGRMQREHPDFIFAGMRHDEDLATHYASGDLFFFASQTETFGNVVTEAMASGLVVVTYDYAAGRQHISHPHDGLLVPYGMAEAFQETCGQLGREPTRWPTLAQAARVKADQISWSRIVDTFEARLLAIAGKSRESAA